MINIEEILRLGIQKNASDIHLVTDKKPLFRINRDLVEINDFCTFTPNDLFDAFYVFTGYNEGIKRAFERDKRIDVNYKFENVRFRVNASLSNNVPIFTLRIIKNELPEYSSLGLPNIVRRLASLPQGLILITGKSNTGKTTTLNALVNEINKTENKKIMMLEDPIEYVHQSNKSLIIQKEVGEGRDCISFSEGTINALREDCDILIVGEVRDRATMDAMLEMAEAGYLVFGTMHTRSCAETIDRIVNFYDLSDQRTIKHLMSSVLKAVISQKLLKSTNNTLVMAPEIMIVDDVISGHIRKENLSKSELEDAILTGQAKGSLSLIFSLAHLIVTNKITPETAKGQLDAKYYDHLDNTVLRMRSHSLNWQF